MYPHERSLVQAMEGKPFVLLGVNSDKTREVAKKAIEREKLTWRSFWNGGSTRGPISSAWGISGWPTLFLIDHKGIIRHKWLGSPGDKVLDEAIEKLVKAAEKDGSEGAKKDGK